MLATPGVTIRAGSTASGEAVAFVPRVIDQFFDGALERRIVLSNCILRSQLGKSERDLDDGSAHGDILVLDDIAVHRFHRPEPTDPAEVEQVDNEPDWGIPELRPASLLVAHAWEATRPAVKPPVPL